MPKQTSDLELDPILLEAARRLAKAERKSLRELLNRAVAEELSRSERGTRVYAQVRRAQAKPIGSITPDDVKSLIATQGTIEKSTAFSSG